MARFQVMDGWCPGDGDAQRRVWTMTPSARASTTWHVSWPSHATASPARAVQYDVEYPGGGAKATIDQAPPGGRRCLAHIRTAEGGTQPSASATSSRTVTPTARSRQILVDAVRWTYVGLP